MDSHSGLSIKKDHFLYLSSNVLFIESDFEIMF